MQIHEKPFHSQKVTIWCAVSMFGVTGPHFFEENNRLLLWILSATALCCKHFWLQNCEGYKGWEMYGFDRMLNDPHSKATQNKA
jgi:hypothetical protein